MSQGRFTGVDPIFFQKGMLPDPQRFSLYAYVRNNPLQFIDPDGEAIRLPDDPKDREAVLNALREAVGGGEAGTYLYANPVVDEKTGETHYYVGILGGGPSGKGPDFKALNKVASVLGRILEDTNVATINLVRPGTLVRSAEGDDAALIGPAGPNLMSTPAATDVTSGQMYVLDPKYNHGVLPGTVMSNGKDNQLDIVTTLIHELRHIAYDWGLITGPSNDAAVTLENWSRQLRDPSGPTRVKHNPQDEKMLTLDRRALNAQVAKSGRKGVRSAIQGY